MSHNTPESLNYGLQSQLKDSGGKFRSLNSNFALTCDLKWIRIPNKNVIRYKDTLRSL